MLMQFSVSVSQPRSIFQSESGHIANSLADGQQAATRVVQNDPQAAKQRQQRLRFLNKLKKNRCK